MTLTSLKRFGIGCLAVSLALLAAGAPAAAITQPVVDAAAAPPAGAPGPVAPFEQRSECLASAVLPGSDVGAVTVGQTALNLPAAWQISRGEGQTVAVLGTGVHPGPRLPAVDAGGDYIGSTDGLTDCDGHGTLVAGLIAGQPAPGDGFAGVAPAARVLALRVTSAAYSPRTAGDDPTRARAELDVTALSRAIVRAADLGARVITIPTVTCVAADRQIDQAALGAALRYAAEEKNAVIVAAAGDTGATGAIGGGSGCESNPLTDLARPADPRNWAGVTSVSLPSVFPQYVLSVAALNAGGDPSGFTMAGPWVGVAATGEGIVSVSNREDGGLANALPGDKGRLVPLSGTGYAAGYVAGVAALVRSHYPDLTAAQVISRITATAHNGDRAPSDRTGAGSVDPVAALTWQLPAAPADADHAVRQVPVPPAPQPEDPTPRIVAFAGTAVLAGLVAAVAAGAAARRRKDNHQ